MKRDDTDDIFHPDLYDISDVEFEMYQPPKKRRHIYITLKSETDFNLVKLYLALKGYVEKIEEELNIMEAAEGEH